MGFGEGTRKNLENLLYKCRRFFWCGSLDLHYSDKEPLHLLNKTTVEFFKANKDSRELHILIQDIEADLLMFFNKVESPKKHLEEDEEEEEIEEDEISDHGEELKMPVDNSPQDALEKLFSQRLSLYQFAIDMLQAKKVPAIEVIKEHPMPKPKSVEEDTTYLEII